MDNIKTSTYWKDCTFQETDSPLLFCSVTELHFPTGAFRSWVPCITSVKSGRTKNHYQEYLINNEKIFKVKGGSKWEIMYICTLEERQKQEEEFGRKMLIRAQNAYVPWHLAKLTREIESDEEAISLLKKIKRIAKKRNITAEQVYALRSVDLELRTVTLKLVLGNEIYHALEYTLRENERLSRLLAYYLAFKGNVNKHDLDKQCRIPNPVSIGFFEEYKHNQRMRVVLAGIPKDLVSIADSISSNEEAIETLKKIKIIAAKGGITASEAFALKSSELEERNIVLKKILGEEIWEKISSQLSDNDDLSYFLGYYLRHKGKI